MKTIDDLLKAWDEHLDGLTEDEIREDVQKVESIGEIGVSYEEYLDILNTVTSYNLVETGLVCDDIAFSDFFNQSIESIDMGDINLVKVIETTINPLLAQPKIGGNSTDYYAGVMSYGIAA